MELKYKLTRAEYQHMAAHDTGNHPKVRQRRVFMMVYFALMAFTLVTIFSESYLLALVAASLGLAAAGPYLQFMRKKSFGGVYDVIAPKEETSVRIDAAGLSLAREHIRSEIDWEGITRLHEDEVGFYLTYGPLQSLYVPRRVFASAGEAQRFWTLAQEYRQFARSEQSGAARI